MLRKFTEGSEENKWGEGKRITSKFKFIHVSLTQMQLQARGKAVVEIPFSFLPQVLLTFSPVLILMLRMGRGRELVVLVVNVFDLNQDNITGKIA